MHSSRPLSWLRDAPLEAKRSLLAASLGWALDSFDVLLFALVLPALMRDLNLTKSSAGLVGSLTLVAAAAGGIVFGLVADRWGRTRALMGSILLYAIFTGACGLAWNFASLVCFRMLLGLGMGGEWASGAALVSETWPAASRDKALALMQSSFAVGYGCAAIVAFVLQPIVGWRGVFAAGLLPALFTLWVRRHVRESDSWLAAKTGPAIAARQGIATIFKRPLLRPTLALTLMNACCLFAWWGFNQWVPAYLSLDPAHGGIGFSARSMTLVILVMQVGMWLGYISFGYLSSAFGRRRMYVTFLVCATILLTLFSRTHSAPLLLILGPLLAFSATGYFSGFAAVTADTYPSAVRATGQGFTYNLGRLASAAAPFTIGTLAQTHGFGSAFQLSAAGFLAAALLWVFL